MKLSYFSIKLCRSPFKVWLVCVLALCKTVRFTIPFSGIFVFYVVMGHMVLNP